MSACPLCGLRFDPAHAPGCEGCPLAPGCGMTCCPACGYSWVEPEQTTLGRWLARRLGWRDEPERCPGRPAATDCSEEVRTLAEVPPHTWARVRECDRLPEARRRQLRSFGLTDGGLVLVLQQAPATVIALGQAEVALERDLAGCILVETMGRHPSQPPERRLSEA